MRANRREVGKSEAVCAYGNIERKLSVYRTYGTGAPDRSTFPKPGLDCFQIVQ